MSDSYPLAPQGVFLTIHGEGALLGEPMIFVRLAGCSVGCAGCDTDYRVHERVTAKEIARRAVAAGSAGVEWIWLTGGEPADHDLDNLLAELRRANFRVALATAGQKAVQGGLAYGGVDFISVSPHSMDSSWVQRRGDQINLVPGLNGLSLTDVEPLLTEIEEGFPRRYVTPCWYAPADRAEKIHDCFQWVQKHPGWRLGIQAHKYWGLA